MFNTKKNILYVFFLLFKKYFLIFIFLIFILDILELIFNKRKTIALALQHETLVFFLQKYSRIIHFLNLQRNIHSFK